MRLTTGLSQNMSLQLTTAMALDSGIREVHDLVNHHEKELTSKGFIADIQSLLTRSNKKLFFCSNHSGHTFLNEIRGKLEKTIEYAVHRHKGENRDSGHPYIAHVLSTGFVLARLGMPGEVILSGILHDAIEDSPDKNKVLNDLYAIDPSVAWYVYSVSGPDIKDAVEKDKLLYKRLETMSDNTGNLFPRIIKCADGIANLYDIAEIKAKDGRTTEERQKRFIESIRIKLLPFASEIDKSGLIPLKKKNEVFLLEEYISDLLQEKENEFSGHA